MKQTALLLVTALLLWGAWLTLGPFLEAGFWAGVLALVTWPLYLRLRAALGKNATWSALAMTGLLTLLLLIPVTVLGLVLTQQALLVAHRAEAWNFAQVLNIPALGTLPWIGPYLQTWVQDLDLPQVVAGIQAQSGTLLKLLTGVGQGVAQALLTLGLTLFTVFFFYRSGDELVAQGYRGLARWGGEEVTSLLEPLAAIIRAVVLGVVVTALAQGLLAGIGFAVVGLGGSLILGLMVVLVALVQLPTALIWLPCAVWLLSQGQLLSGALLFAWGLGVVSTIDNFLKPIFISQGTGLPFLLVCLGILGGLLAFGTPGLVLGPALLALLQILWQRWSSAS